MIDSHCHLFFDSIKNNINDVINRSIESKITAILSINTKFDEFHLHYNLIKNYQSVFISVGQHPDNVGQKNIISKNDILNICNKYEKVIGIGETGLDFYHSYDYKKEQYISFENQIEASLESKLPLIIHQRNSEDEIIEVLNSYQKQKTLKIVFHCFTGSSKLLNFCLDNNYFISLSGIITFKNANNLREIIKSLPLNNLRLETDSPFLSPSPLRGKSNEPANIKYIAEYLSLFYKIPLNEFIKITDNNFYNLFSKAIRYNKISI